MGYSEFNTTYNHKCNSILNKFDTQYFKYFYYNTDEKCEPDQTFMSNCQS